MNRETESINKKTNKIKSETLYFKKNSNEKVFIMGELKNKPNYFLCIDGKNNEFELHYATIVTHYQKITEDELIAIDVTKEMIKTTNENVPGGMENCGELFKEGIISIVEVGVELTKNINKSSNLCSRWKL